MKKTHVYFTYAAHTRIVCVANCQTKVSGGKSAGGQHDDIPFPTVKHRKKKKLTKFETTRGKIQNKLLKTVNLTPKIPENPSLHL